MVFSNQISLFIIYLQKYRWILPIFLHINTKSRITWLGIAIIHILPKFTLLLQWYCIKLPSSGVPPVRTISIERKVAAVGEFGTYLSKTEENIFQSLPHGLKFSTVLSSVLFPQNTTNINNFFVILRIFRPTDPLNFYKFR